MANLNSENENIHSFYKEKNVWITPGNIFGFWSGHKAQKLLYIVRLIKRVSRWI